MKRKDVKTRRRSSLEMGGELVENDGARLGGEGGVPIDSNIDHVINLWSPITHFLPLLEIMWS